MTFKFIAKSILFISTLAAASIAFANADKIACPSVEDVKQAVPGLKAYLPYKMKLTFENGGAEVEDTSVLAEAIFFPTLGSSWVISVNMPGTVAKSVAIEKAKAILAKVNSRSHEYAKESEFFPYTVVCNYGENDEVVAATTTFLDGMNALKTHVIR